ncbi:tetratricopeptide repeat protein 14 isoform X1 [Carcharodon carcharias]|uniref:tetratricopeptide repeat protein 14 isoform X1 n=1 Tax=Carcharodon carcharias TaxID=13397 RepID=UPI001B7ECC93|nr:tetratricopeptide repeat protein 14 isoform X1 [Carcharodon carcharias]
MNKDLMRQSVGYHGPTLLSLLKSEQYENTDIQSVSAEFLKTALHHRRDRRIDNIAIQQFIARKADLLFAPSWKSTASTELNDEETEDYYAIMPPMEQLMEVPSDDKRQYFFRDIERGDIVIGRVASIRDFGFFMTLISLGGDLRRDIESLEITALCPVRDVPSHGKHDDPLSYFQVGDLIRAVLKDVDRYHERLAVTLHPSALPTHLSHWKLGVISGEDLPAYYRRNSTLGNPIAETYDKILHCTLGFANPSTVEYLLGKLGISEIESPSLMRGLQSKNFIGDDYAAALRKKQSASWALKCVKSGVEHFKAGRHVDAMNEYNKALEIDSNNVEALVARGALYATKGSLNKAISDFDLALETCPTHRNAKKYLCQTLVERGGQLEEEEKLTNAENCYKKALKLDETFGEAEEALQKLRKHMQKSLEKKEKETREEEKTIEVSSAEKLRKLLKEEKRMKKKRKRSTSSSSTDSSESSSWSTSSPSPERYRKHKSTKKRRRKRSDSSHSQKRRLSKSSCDEKVHHSHNNKKEWYTPPADTSASFLNQKQEVTKLLEKNDSSVDQWSEILEKRRYCSISSSSVEVLDPLGGRSEDSRDSSYSSRTQDSSSQYDKWHKVDKGRELCDKISNDQDKFRKRAQEYEFGNEYSSKKCDKSNRNYSGSSGLEYSHLSGDKYQHERKNSWLSNSNSKDKRHDFGKSGDGRKDFIHESGASYKDWKGESESDKRENSKDSPHNHNSAQGKAVKSMPQNLLEIFNQIAEFEKGKEHGGKCKQKHK